MEGSYADETALTLFKNASIRHYRIFEDVFEAVNKGEAPFGIVPVENSTAGSVHEVYDLIIKYRFYVVGSYSLEVNHCLCARKVTANRRKCKTNGLPIAAPDKSFRQATPSISVAANGRKDTWRELRTGRQM